MIARDLHIFQDLEAYHAFQHAGGDGVAIYRDPEGGGLPYACVETLVLRDVYLHDDIYPSDEDWRRLEARMRHPYSSKFYSVSETFAPAPKPVYKCDHCEDGAAYVRDATPTGTCPRCGADVEIPF